MIPIARRTLTLFTPALLAAGALAAQAGACEKPGQRTGDLGIGWYHCVGGTCWIRDYPGDRGLEFSIEPLLRELTSTGAARQAGLRDGDALVSLDGVPITVPGAGRALANLPVDADVVLRVRREGRLLEPVTVRPTAGCRIPGLAVTPTKAWPPEFPPLPRPARPAPPSPTKAWLPESRPLPRPTRPALPTPRPGAPTMRVDSPASVGHDREVGP